MILLELGHLPFRQGKFILDPFRLDFQKFSGFRYPLLPHLEILFKKKGGQDVGYPEDCLRAFALVTDRKGCGHGRWAASAAVKYLAAENLYPNITAHLGDYFLGRPFVAQIRVQVLFLDDIPER